jgi:hypothetical protein
MDNPEKLPIYGTEDEEKHNIICVVHQHTQTNINNVDTSPPTKHCSRIHVFVRSEIDTSRVSLKGNYTEYTITKCILT